MTDRAIHQVNIEREMRDAYLSYAMSVIVSRALPDARDGLKPVHRRILYAMHDMGMNPGGAHKKSARIVGEVLGKYHPHGDTAVYETMVRMAQDFSMRYMLIDGQGNFGSIDGDSAAAMRYTEARMASFGSQLLVDINKETVDFVENFDGTLNEPSVLPSVLPNLLVNGASGIAVGMSTNIPPHNLAEICDALVHILDQWERFDDIDVDELIRFVRGPDFPTGGVIYKMRGGEDMLRAAFATGRGKITLRAKVHVEDMGRGKSRVIVSELPYQTNKTTLIERIAALVSSGRLDGLADLRDESDRQNTVRLVIELQRGANVKEVLAALFKLTPLQSTFGIIMLALVDGQPRLLNLKQALRVYLEHRLEVVQRRSSYDLARARERAHVLEGLIVALDNLEAVIATIRKSRNVETARKNLIKNFKVTEVQAAAILDMPLRRLSSLEIRKIRQEHRETLKLIASLEALLASPQKQRMHISEELLEAKEIHGDQRRSIIVDGEASALTVEDFLVPEEKTVVIFSTRGQLGRMRLDEPPRVTTVTKVPPRLLQHSTTGQILHLFTNQGNCATVPVQQIPQVEQASDGMHFGDLSSLPVKRKIVTFMCLPMNFETGYLCFATAQGQVKRLHVGELPGMMSHEFRVMNLAKNDRLVSVLYSSGADELILLTSRGYAIRFNEEDVRPTGSTSSGVRGIQLKDRSDRVVGACLAHEKLHAWIVAEDGIAMTTPIHQLNAQARGGVGKAITDQFFGGRQVVAAAVGRLDDTILVLTSRNKAKYMSIRLANHMAQRLDGRNPVIALREKETVVGVVEYRKRIDSFVVDSGLPDDEISPVDEGDSSADESLSHEEVQSPAQLEMTLEEIELLLDEADKAAKDDANVNPNGADSGAINDA
ncbi:MAG: DNA topoisomerase 4 subunit A [Chloroflexi bacterium]|nr:DNA topoisomerase 4 subunit A [Chloroflexota bacterium]